MENPYPTTASAPLMWTPPPTLGFSEAITVCLRNYATFTGRSSRSEFWYFLLFLVLTSVLTSLIGVALAVILTSAGIDPNTASAAVLLPYLIALAFAVPYLAAQVRRLHDLGHGGGWVLANFLPFGGLVLLFVLSGEGQRHPNRWDERESGLTAPLFQPAGSPPHQGQYPESRDAAFTPSPSLVTDAPTELGAVMTGVAPQSAGREPDSEAALNSGVEPSRTRALPVALGIVAVLILVIVSGFVWGESRRDSEMQELLTNASRSEAAMNLLNERLEKEVTEFDERFALEEPSEDEVDAVLFAVQREAIGLLPRLVDARAAIGDVRVLPWHGDIRQFQEDYISHLDAWIEGMEVAQERPWDWLNEPSQQVATTWLATLRSAHAAGKGRGPTIQTEITRLFPLSDLEPS